MKSTYEPLVDFYYRCYKEDKRNIVISNLFKLNISDRFLFNGEDWLASGRAPRMPIPLELAEKLDRKSAEYKREKELLYSAIFICGANDRKFFDRPQQLCSPLFYQRVRIIFEHESAYIEPISELEVNQALLSELVEEDSADDTGFPEPNNSLSNLSAHVSWLNNHTRIENAIDALYFPKLFAPDQLESAHKGNSLQVVSASAFTLSDKPRISGALSHELESLKKENLSNTPIIDILFNIKQRRSKKYDSSPESLPVILSQPQKKALLNAASCGNSIVFGPPGTGKSFTISSIVIDRVLAGEKVLIVAETDQALEVIENQIKNIFGLEHGIVRSGKGEYLRDLKEYIDFLLTKNFQPIHFSDVKALKRKIGDLFRLQKQLEKKYFNASKMHVSWGRLFRDNIFKTNIFKEFLFRIIKIRINRRQSIDILITNYLSIFKKRKRLAIKYLALVREFALYLLLENNRDKLSLFNKSIRSRKSSKQEEYFSNIDFEVLLEAFPIWLVSLDSLYKVLPINKNIFDLVIFDESSQISIAKALPALFRAKRAVVAGDTKQLRHVTFLSAKSESEIYHALPGSVGRDLASISYRDKSLLDVALLNGQNSASCVLLDEHFRSKPCIIKFSNEEFYRSQLKIMQHRPGEISNNLKFHSVKGIRKKDGTNHEEVAYIFDMLQVYFDQYKNSPTKPTIGILSPYRKQTDYINRLLKKNNTFNLYSDYQLLVGTPYHFQGEERDIMILSFSIDNNSLAASSYLNKEDMFNVAITRARSIQHIVYSVDKNTLNTNNLFRRYLNFDHSGRAIKREENTDICSFQDEVCFELDQLDIKNWKGYTLANQNIDILCEVNGEFIGIDLIGFSVTYEEFYDIKTYLLFERIGISIIPISYKTWMQDKDSSLKLITNKIRIKPTLHKN